MCLRIALQTHVPKHFAWVDGWTSDWDAVDTVSKAPQQRRQKFHKFLARLGRLTFMECIENKLGVSVVSKRVVRYFNSLLKFLPTSVEQNLLVFSLWKKFWAKQKSMSYVSIIVKTSGQVKLHKIFSITFNIHFWRYCSLYNGSFDTLFVQETYLLI